MSRANVTTQPEPRRTWPHVSTRGAFAAVATLVPLGALIVARADNLAQGAGELRIEPWLEGQYNFSYEHEFVRRGLIGEVIRRSGFPDGSLALHNLSAVLYLALGGMVAWLAWSGFRKLDLRRRTLLSAGVLALPFSLPHFAFDIGRTDVIFYVVTLWLLGTSAPPVLVFAIVGLTAVLVHELFVLAFIPLLAYGLLRQHEARIAQPRLLALLAGAGIAAALVVVAGDLESVPEREYAQELEQAVPDYDGSWADGNVPAHSMLYKDVGFQVRRSLDRWAPVRVLHTLAAAVPGALLAWWLYRLRPDPAVLRGIAVTTLPLLTLFVLGIDAPRWVALMSFNVLLVGLLELCRRPATDEELARTGWISWALAATILLGPIGVLKGYPVWATLWDAVT